MRIQSLGHSAFLLHVEGHRVLIDPFIEGNPRCPTSVQELQQQGISAVVLSHAHGDHWGSTMDFAREGATVIATVEIATYAGQQGAQNVVPMNIGGTVRQPWGSVTLTPAWHSSSFPDGTYGGMPTGIVIEAGGKRVYHAGDTSRFLDMQLIGDLGLDVALLPVGDHFTMGPAEAAWSLELLRPRLAVPMHYATFPVLTGDPHEFARLASQAGVESRVLEPGEVLELT